jgi:DNA-binding NarL/FixJ family response regulator
MKILVVDDHALVREGLKQVLKGLDENVEVLQAGTVAQAFVHARDHADLDLILLDYHLPDMTGLQALDVLGKEHPELPVVMLSGSANLQIMRDLLQSGAAGFVTKSGLSDELLDAIRKVLQGEVYVPPELGSAPGTSATAADSEAEKTLLTHRQMLVLDGLLAGQSNREIANALSISEETVKSHVTSILRHFEVQNRTQAVVAATRLGYKSA